MCGETLVINGQSCFTSVWVSLQAGCGCDPPALLPVACWFPTPSRARGCSHPSCGQQLGGRRGAVGPGLALWSAMFPKNKLSPSWKKPFYCAMRMHSWERGTGLNQLSSTQHHPGLRLLAQPSHWHGAQPPMPQCLPWLCVLIPYWKTWLEPGLPSYCVNLCPVSSCCCADAAMHGLVPARLCWWLCWPDTQPVENPTVRQFAADKASCSQLPAWGWSGVGPFPSEIRHYHKKETQHTKPKPNP